MESGESALAWRGTKTALLSKPRLSHTPRMLVATHIRLQGGISTGAIYLGGILVREI